MQIGDIEIFVVVVAFTALAILAPSFFEKGDK